MWSKPNITYNIETYYTYKTMEKKYKSALLSIRKIIGETTSQDCNMEISHKIVNTIDNVLDEEKEQCPNHNDLTCLAFPMTLSKITALEEYEVSIRKINNQFQIKKTKHKIKCLKQKLKELKDLK